MRFDARILVKGLLSRRPVSANGASHDSLGFQPQVIIEPTTMSANGAFHQKRYEWKVADARRGKIGMDRGTGRFMARAFSAGEWGAMGTWG